jgi:hypothetical protein
MQPMCGSLRPSLPLAQQLHRYRQLSILPLADQPLPGTLTLPPWNLHTLPGPPLRSIEAPRDLPFRTNLHPYRHEHFESRGARPLAEPSRFPDR